MKRNKRLATRGSALPVIIAVILTLAAGAWAQSEYKTLHAFTGASNDGANPEAGLISDRSGNLMARPPAAVAAVGVPSLS
jgi:hypothetical protein